MPPDATSLLPVPAHRPDGLDSTTDDSSETQRITTSPQKPKTVSAAYVVFMSGRHGPQGRGGPAVAVERATLCRSRRGFWDASCSQAAREHHLSPGKRHRSRFNTTVTSFSDKNKCWPGSKHLRKCRRPCYPFALPIPPLELSIPPQIRRSECSFTCAPSLRMPLVSRRCWEAINGQIDGNSPQ